MHDYYYRGDNEEDEVIIQAVGDKFSVRVREENDGGSSMVLLKEEELDWMIAGLEEVRRKIKEYQARNR